MRIDRNRGKVKKTPFKNRALSEYSEEIQEMIMKHPTPEYVNWDAVADEKGIPLLAPVEASGTPVVDLLEELQADITEIKITLNRIERFTV